MKQVVSVLVVLLCCAVLAASCTAFVANPTYKVDNAAQLQVLYAAVGVILLVCAVAIGTRVGVAFALASLLTNAIMLAPLFVPDRRGAANAAPTGDSVKILAANLCGRRNTKYDDLVKLVHAEKPDYLCLSELTAQWQKEVKARLPEYRYELHEPAAGGSALYSKVPMKSYRAFQRHVPHRYGAAAFVPFGEQQVLLISAHPPSPSSRRRWLNRNDEFERLVADCATTDGAPHATVIAGDLNVTPWGWYFKQFQEKSGLIDSSRSFGLQLTWPANKLPVVPIDHCLHSPEIVTIARKVGPAVGSDHLPLIVELRMNQ